MENKVKGLKIYHTNFVITTICTRWNWEIPFSRPVSNSGGGTGGTFCILERWNEFTKDLKIYAYNVKKMQTCPCLGAIKIDHLEKRTAHVWKKSFLERFSIFCWLLPEKIRLQLSWNFRTDNTPISIFCFIKP